MIVPERFPAFCPVCAGPMIEQFVVEEGRSRDVCARCGHIFYHNPKVVAGTLPVIDGRIWLLRRAIEPRYGAWTFPAGFMEMAETVEECAVRETREELGLDVDLGPLVGIYSRPAPGNVHIVYLAGVAPDAEPLPGPEALEYAAFTAATIPWEELAFWSTQQALHDWINRFEANGRS